MSHVPYFTRNWQFINYIDIVFFQNCFVLKEQIGNILIKSTSSQCVFMYLYMLLLSHVYLGFSKSSLKKQISKQAKNTLSLWNHSSWAPNLKTSKKVYSPYYLALSPFCWNCSYFQQIHWRTFMAYTAYLLTELTELIVPPSFCKRVIFSMASRKLFSLLMMLLTLGLLLLCFSPVLLSGI